MVKLLHTGDLGDVLAALPILRQLGGGEIFITNHPIDRRGPRLSLKGRRFDAIVPLLRAQSYVHNVHWIDEPENVGITHDLTRFRRTPWQARETLTEWQARALNIHLDEYETGWMSVPKVEPNGLVVMARSPRYHNYFFPWEDLAKFYPNAVFVGLEDEYNALRLYANRKQLKWHQTADLLELATLIAGATLTICNQSCPFWIAAGLGVPLIQETWEEQPNSLVRRKNAIYTLTGPETRTLIYRLFPPSVQATTHNASAL